jgi:hypothetical protein
MNPTTIDYSPISGKRLSKGGGMAHIPASKTGYSKAKKSMRIGSYTTKKEAKASGAKATKGASGKARVRKIKGGYSTYVS